VKSELLYRDIYEEKEQEQYPFTIEEMKFAAEAVADCYKRIESGTAKILKKKD
jgi:hypothetical protein